MFQAQSVDASLIARPAQSAPRYWSYPTPECFTEAFGYRDYLHAVADLRTRGGAKALSLYVHIPSCVTKPYLAYLKREIEMQGRLFAGMNHVAQLHVGGGTATRLSDTQLRELVAHLRRCFPFVPDAQASCAIEVDPRTLAPARLAKLRRLGFNRVSLSVQDPDRDVRLELIEAARAAAFRSVSIDLVYGLPRQTLATLDALLAQVAGAAPDRIAVDHGAHLPALQLCIARLGAAGYVTVGVDHFAKPGDDLAIAQAQGRLRLTLRGYSSQPDMDLVACGVSAIGAVGATYSQNTGTLGAYVEHLDRNELPIVRGVRLTLDDVLRRSVIQRLMCQFELSIPAVEQAFPIVFVQYFAREMDALAQLEGEGLVDVADGWISVTPRGRLLVRDVCMVFDRYLAQPARAA